MRAKFRAPTKADVIRVVQYLSAVERASIEIEEQPRGIDHVIVSLTLGDTDIEDLRRHMQTMPGGTMMSDTLAPENQFKHRSYILG